MNNPSALTVEVDPSYLSGNQLYLPPGGLKTPNSSNSSKSTPAHRSDRTVSSETDGGLPAPCAETNTAPPSPSTNPGLCILTNTTSSGSNPPAASDHLAGGLNSSSNTTHSSSSAQPQIRPRTERASSAAIEDETENTTPPESTRTPIRGDNDSNGGTGNKPFLVSPTSVPAPATSSSNATNTSILSDRRLSNSDEVMGVGPHRAPLPPHHLISPQSAGALSKSESHPSLLSSSVSSQQYDSVVATTEGESGGAKNAAYYSQNTSGEGEEASTMPPSSTSNSEGNISSGTPSAGLMSDLALPNFFRDGHSSSLNISTSSQATTANQSVFSCQFGHSGMTTGGATGTPSNGGSPSGMRSRRLLVMQAGGMPLEIDEDEEEEEDELLHDDDALDQDEERIDFSNYVAASGESAATLKEMSPTLRILGHQVPTGDASPLGLLRPQSELGSSALSSKLVSDNDSESSSRPLSEASSPAEVSTGAVTNPPVRLLRASNNHYGLNGGNLIKVILPSSDFPDQEEMSDERSRGYGKLLLAPIAFAWNSPEEKLKEHNVGGVLSCVSAQGDELRSILQSCGIEKEDHFCLPLDDSKDVGAGSISLSIAPQGHPKTSLEEAVDFIHTRRVQGKSVLVHCDMGVQRSPSACCAYLVLQYCLDYKEATTFMRRVAPRSNFRMFASSLRKIVSEMRQRHHLDCLGSGSVQSHFLGSPGCLGSSQSPMQLQMPPMFGGKDFSVFSSQPNTPAAAGGGGGGLRGFSNSLLDGSGRFGGAETPHSGTGGGGSNFFSGSSFQPPSIQGSPQHQRRRGPQLLGEPTVFSNSFQQQQGGQLQQMQQPQQQQPQHFFNANSKEDSLGSMFHSGIPHYMENQPIGSGIPPPPSLGGGPSSGGILPNQANRQLRTLVSNPTALDLDDNQDALSSEQALAQKKSCNKNVPTIRKSPPPEEDVLELNLLQLPFHQKKTTVVAPTESSSSQTTVVVPPFAIRRKSGNQ